MDKTDCTRLLQFMEFYSTCDAWDKTRLELKMVALLMKKPRCIALAAQVLFTITLPRFAPLVLALVLAVLIFIALT